MEKVVVEEATKLASLTFALVVTIGTSPSMGNGLAITAMTNGAFGIVATPSILDGAAAPVGVVTIEPPSPRIDEGAGVASTSPFLPVVKRRRSNVRCPAGVIPTVTGGKGVLTFSEVYEIEISSRPSSVEVGKTIAPRLRSSCLRHHEVARKVGPTKVVLVPPTITGEPCGLA